MNTFTRIDVLDLDDTPFASPDSVDSMHPESTAADKPRHHLLSHSSSLCFIVGPTGPL